MLCHAPNASSALTDRAGDAEEWSEISQRSFAQPPAGRRRCQLGHRQRAQPAHRAWRSKPAAPSTSADLMSGKGRPTEATDWRPAGCPPRCRHRVRHPPDIQWISTEHLEHIHRTARAESGRKTRNGPRQTDLDSVKLYSADGFSCCLGARSNNRCAPKGLYRPHPCCKVLISRGSSTTPSPVKPLRFAGIAPPLIGKQDALRRLGEKAV